MKAFLNQTATLILVALMFASLRVVSYTATLVYSAWQMEAK